MVSPLIAIRSRDVISCRVKSLFTLFMLAALVCAQGTSLATSICRHGSLQAHVAALQSHDTRKAAVAYAEDTADAAAAKKGSVSDAGSGPLLVALLPPSAPGATLSLRESLSPRATDRPPLVGISLRPPLPPPLA
jgi:hypothetical protein